jgi:hypothetical protein
MTSDPDTSDPRRIAVIAVHGVANQEPGETVGAIANLLINLDESGGPAYERVSEETIRVPVRKVEVPPPPADKWEEYREHKGFYQRAPALRAQRKKIKAAQEATTGGGPRAPQVQDVGHDFMTSLLEKYEPDGPSATFETTRIRLSRKPTADGQSPEVDVYEMYWADLSRLTQSFLRMFAELYQLLFHLAHLGVHAVTSAEVGTAEFSEAEGAWPWWRKSQRIAALSLSIGFPVLNLFFAGLLVALMAEWVATPTAAFLDFLSVGLAGALLVGILVYKRNLTRWLFILAALFVAGGIALGVVAAGDPSQFAGVPDWPTRVLVTEALAVVGLVIAIIVNLYERVRRGANRAALVAGAIVLGAVIWRLWITGLNQTPAFATLFGGEVTYALLATDWLLFIIASWIAALAGGQIKRAFKRAAKSGAAGGVRDYARMKQTAWTARLTLAVPSAAFLIVTISIWAGVWTAVAGTPEKPQPPSSTATSSTEPSPSDEFLRRPYQLTVPVLKDIVGRVEPRWPAVEKEATYNRVWAFIMTAAGPGYGYLMATVLLVVVLTLYALLPPVLTEIFPALEAESRRIGGWLNNGFFVLRVGGELLYFAVIVALPLAFIVVMNLPPKAAKLVEDFNGDLLRYGGLLLVPAAAGLFAFGGRLKNVLLGFRNVLDVALDVDNYLREQPRDSCPRARMCARMASLLRKIDRDQYHSIVIIAHSQGTMITADLLRYLHRHDVQAANPDLANLDQQTVRFFTMGSPLRQLYSLRFPYLYSWARHFDPVPKDVTVPIPADSKPSPTELGLAEWVNVYRSGDYIGRHVWRPDLCAFGFDAAAVDRKNPWPVAAIPAEFTSKDDTGQRHEYCLGVGAHTHYWDANAPLVAQQLDRLITNT